MTRISLLQGKNKINLKEYMYTSPAVYMLTAYQWWSSTGTCAPSRVPHCQDKTNQLCDLHTRNNYEIQIIIIITTTTENSC
jgi:hypothetical protein